MILHKSIAWHAYVLLILDFQSNRLWFYEKNVAASFHDRALPPAVSRKLDTCSRMLRRYQPPAESISVHCEDQKVFE